jgi:energy-coupling factor transporter transmembrane protein EcfT
VAYLAWVVLVTSVHDLRFLCAAGAIVLILSGRRVLRVGRRTLLAVAWFSLVITASYVALSLPRGGPSWSYVARVNLRVAVLAASAFLLAASVNPLRLFAFSRTLLFIVTIAYAQILTLGRVLEDFRLALRSRALRRPGLRDLYRHRAAAGSFLFSRSLENAGEINQAMKSRGFFDDRR